VDLLGRRLLVGFDAEAVSVAATGRGPVRRRVRGFRRAALEPGALTPAPAGPNVIRRDEVREALGEAIADVAPGAGSAKLFLPDGIARLAVVDPPPGAEPRDYVRFRLAPSLPWPASEAIVDLLPLGGGRVVGAAVRRTTVAQYEQLAGSAGLSVERVHLAPLVAIGALLGRGRGTRRAVHAVLGDVAVCLAVIRSGELVALRNRRRDPSEGEGHRLLAEAVRTARLAGDGDGPVPLSLSGSGSIRLRDALGPAAEAGGLDGPGGWAGAAEAAWLAGALA
jgi:hypothetical protein